MAPSLNESSCNHKCSTVASKSSARNVECIGVRVLSYSQHILGSANAHSKYLPFAGNWPGNLAPLQSPEAAMTTALRQMFT